MTIRNSVGLGAVSLWLSLAATIALSWEDPPRPVSSQVKALRAVMDRQVECWNRQDLDGFLATYWNSPELVFQSGADLFRGWDAVRERYEARYRGEGREMGRLEFLDRETLLLGEDAGFVRGRWRLVLSNGKSVEGRFTVISRRFADGWKIVHDHTSARTP